MFWWSLWISSASIAIQKLSKCWSVLQCPSVFKHWSATVQVWHTNIWLTHSFKKNYRIDPNVEPESAFVISCRNLQERENCFFGQFFPEAGSPLLKDPPPRGTWAGRLALYTGVSLLPVTQPGIRIISNHWHPASFWHRHHTWPASRCQAGGHQA